MPTCDGQKYTSCGSQMSLYKAPLCIVITACSFIMHCNYNAFNYNEVKIILREEKARDIAMPRKCQILYF